MFTVLSCLEGLKITAKLPTLKEAELIVRIYQGKQIREIMETYMNVTATVKPYLWMSAQGIHI